MKKNNKECTGCFMNRFCNLNISCVDPKTNKLIRCPCINCLVKTMCGYGDACEEYEYYRHLIINKINKNK